MDVSRVRKIMQTIGFGGLALILATVGYVQSVPLAIAMMSLGNIFGGAMAGGFGVNHLDIAPRGAGVIMGLSNTAATIPGILEIEVQPIRNSVTGEPHLARVVLPGGFEFNEADLASGSFSASGDLKLDYKDRTAIFSRFVYGPQGIVT
jgi:hypothetical protein